MNEKFSNSLLFPSAAVILHLLIVDPLFIASVVGLMGFVQFLLGMRENRIIGLLIFVVIFGALYGGVGGIMGSDFAVSLVASGNLVGCFVGFSGSNSLFSQILE